MGVPRKTSFWRGMPSSWADTESTVRKRMKREIKKMGNDFLDIRIPSFFCLFVGTDFTDDTVYSFAFESGLPDCKGA